VSDLAAFRPRRPLDPHLQRDDLVSQTRTTPEGAPAALRDEPVGHSVTPALDVLRDCVRVDGGLRELGERLAAVLQSPFDEAAVAALDEYLTGEGRRAAVEAWVRLNEEASDAEPVVEHQATRTSPELLAQLREQPSNDTHHAAPPASGARGGSGARFVFGRPRRPRWGTEGAAC